MKTIYILESSVNNGKTFIPICIDKHIHQNEGYAAALCKGTFFTLRDAKLQCKKYRGFTSNFKLRIVAYQRNGVTKTYNNL